MDTRVLPGIERPWGRVGLGTLAFGAAVGPDEAVVMVKTAIAAGVTMFDTANAYTGGASERLLGQALGARRDECLIATKAHHRHGPGPDDAGLSPAAIRLALEGGLGRLGTDWVDLLYFHQPDWEVPFEESLGAAQELVEAGKVRAVALSNYPAWEIARGHAVADHRGWPRPRIHQLMYNLLARGVEEEYAAFATGAGLVNVVYNPLAGGLLTGRYDRADLPEVGRFSSEVYRDRYWHGPVFEAVQQLQVIAREAGLTLVELSYAWLWSRPLVDVVLLGAASLAQLEANLAAAAHPALSDDVLAACDEVWQRLRGPVPRYWR